MRTLKNIAVAAVIGVAAPSIAAHAEGTAAPTTAPAEAATQAEGAVAPAAEAAPAAAGPQLDAEGKVILAEGLEVLDTQGDKVGVLTKVETDASGQTTNVILKTENSEVLIPASSLARTETNALIAMTAAQIDAAAAAAGAPASATN